MTKKRLKHYTELRTATGAFMLDKGLSQTGLAELIGASQAVVSDWLQANTVLREKPMEKLIELLTKEGVYKSEYLPKVQKRKFIASKKRADGRTNSGCIGMGSRRKGL